MVSKLFTVSIVSAVTACNFGEDVANYTIMVAGATYNCPAAMEFLSTLGVTNCTQAAETAHALGYGAVFTAEMEEEVKENCAGSCKNCATARVSERTSRASGAQVFAISHPRAFRHRRQLLATLESQHEWTSCTADPLCWAGFVLVTGTIPSEVGTLTALTNL
ncbi:hypothetical protein CYMTET_48032 [Cymbomonas tetramitiformis]|uniref:Uncharacterized protein n=1 Tax=Cymbomonas tetramitiformis TaxID=36881 RepID=A0AAE0EX56_9CHLO|nr:hypothetical protein CYMTET_48032 [Cymbomonas tetramitiformis]